MEVAKWNIVRFRMGTAARTPTFAKCTPVFAKRIPGNARLSNKPTNNLD